MNRPPQSCVDRYSKSKYCVKAKENELKNQPLLWGRSLLTPVSDFGWRSITSSRPQAIIVINSDAGLKPVGRGKKHLLNLQRKGFSFLCLIFFIFSITVFTVPFILELKITLFALEGSTQLCHPPSLPRPSNGDGKNLFWEKKKKPEGEPWGIPLPRTGRHAIIMIKKEGMKSTFKRWCCVCLPEPDWELAPENWGPENWRLCPHFWTLRTPRERSSPVGLWGATSPTKMGGCETMISLICGEKHV